MSLSFRKRERSTSVDEITIPDNQKWSTSKDQDLLDLMGMSTRIIGCLTTEQIEAYQIVFRIEEISQKLRHEKFLNVPPSKEPPPAPRYDATGKRINTPEYLYRKQLENERHLLVESAIRAIPGYSPPSDYKRPGKLVEKVFIPVKEYPEINFIGLLIGPRGNTLRKMEEESGAKIAIRGKGSVKEGKNRSVNERQNNLDDDLHCLVTAEDETKLKKGIAQCKMVIDKAAFTPEGQNDLKRGQLRELAAINGTLREYEERPCPNCGELGHKRYDCPKKKQYLETVVCRICGNAGHFARDCKQRGQHNMPGNGSFPQANNLLNSADQEYQQMLKDLNGGDISVSDGVPIASIENGLSQLPQQLSQQQYQPPSNIDESSYPPFKKRNIGTQYNDYGAHHNRYKNNGTTVSDSRGPLSGDSYVNKNYQQVNYNNNGYNNNYNGYNNNRYPNNSNNSNTYYPPQRGERNVYTSTAYSQNHPLSAKGTSQTPPIIPPPGVGLTPPPGMMSLPNAPPPGLGDLPPPPPPPPLSNSMPLIAADDDGAFPPPPPPPPPPVMDISPPVAPPGFNEDAPC